MEASNTLQHSFNPRRDLFLFATVMWILVCPSSLDVSIPGGICSSLRPFLLKGHMLFRLVSIPGGICSSLRLGYKRSCKRYADVSIPGGICSSLRHVISPLHILCQSSFNPRRDLFLFATPSGLLSSFFSSLFQSQAGFVPLCDL